MELSALAEAPAARVRAVDPDAALVARARVNPREFLGLYDRYFDRVLGYARLRVADPATCEDVTSRVFTTALEQLGRFRGEGTFAGWVFQIARNTVRDVHRRRPTVPLAEERPAAGLTPEEHVLERERAQELRAQIRLLRPEHQHLLAPAPAPILDTRRLARSSAPLPLRCVSGCTGSSKTYDAFITR